MQLQTPHKRTEPPSGALFSPGGHATPTNIVTTKLLQLYSPSEDTDLVASCLYNNDATFTDPLVAVSGKSHIQAQFRVLRLFFRSSEVTLKHFSLKQDPDGPADDDSGTLFVSFKVTFYPRLCPAWIWAPSLLIDTKCEVRNGRVDEHIDHWCLASVVRNVPVLGLLYNMARLVLGWFLSVAINVVMPPS